MALQSKCHKQSLDPLLDTSEDQKLKNTGRKKMLGAGREEPLNDLNFSTNVCFAQNMASIKRAITMILLTSFSIIFDVIYDTTVAQQVDRVVQWLEGSNPAALQFIAVFLGNKLTLNCCERAKLAPWHGGSHPSV